MPYLIILLLVGLAAVMLLGALAASRLLAPHRPGGVKNEPYECGEKPIGSAWVREHLGFDGGPQQRRRRRHKSQRIRYAALFRWQLRLMS